MANWNCCDGVTRRDFLRVGALGASAVTLGGYMRMLEAGEVSKNAKSKAVIFVNLRGGPTHMDTFDPKPEASTDVRGEFKAIATKADGVQICEHLPKLAKVADLFTILRGVSHTLAAHEFGTKYMNTGNRPIASIEYPAIGSVVSKELKSLPDLPSYVAVPDAAHGPGFLGISQAPFNTSSTPVAGQPYSVRGIALGRGLTVAQLDKRQNLLENLDIAFRGYEESSDVLKGLDKFSDQAYQIISSKKSREAFDISKEATSISSQFAPDPFSQSCLLATRLVEAGVKFVTVSSNGWDTHQDVFGRLKTKLLPPLDAGLAGLFQTLKLKGLLETTTVYVTGEFGRTPKINANAGRDHWPRAMFVLLAGGGIRGGRVFGASDAKGMGPAKNPITPEDVAATLFATLGIDHHKEYHTNSGRPVMIVRNGTPIKELLS